MVFSLGNLFIIGEKPENCEIPEIFPENSDNFGRIGFKQ